MVAPLVPIGTVIVVRGVQLVAVPLSKIHPPAFHELSHSRLIQLRHGFNSLEDILRSPNWSGDPITLTRVGNRFEIIDGRHRVSLAIEKAKEGFEYVWARVLN